MLSNRSTEFPFHPVPNPWEQRCYAGEDERRLLPAAAQVPTVEPSLEDKPLLQPLHPSPHYLGVVPAPSFRDQERRSRVPHAHTQLLFLATQHVVRHVPLCVDTGGPGAHSVGHCVQFCQLGQVWRDSVSGVKSPTHLGKTNQPHRGIFVDFTITVSLISTIRSPLLGRQAKPT